MSALPPTVVLVGGWSWHRHVGDDAVLRAHLAELALVLPRHEAIVVCGEPDRLAERFAARCVSSAGPAIGDLRDPVPHEAVTSAMLVPVVEQLVAEALAGRARDHADFGPMVEAIERADAVIAVSAGSLATAYPVTIAEQVVALAIAQALGKPTAVSGASLGPFAADDQDLLGGVLAAADLVAVRDRTVSVERAARLGVATERLVVQHDPAWWMEPAPATEADAALRGAGIDPAAEFGVLTVAPWPAGSEQSAVLAAVVDRIAAERGTRFLGMPMFMPPGVGDGDALRAVRARVADPQSLELLDPLPDDPALLALAGRADVVVGSRFHGAVFAAASGTPAVLVHDGAYQRDKAESLAASTGLVGAVPLDAGSATIARAALELMGSSPPAAAPLGPLPAIAWLRDRLSAALAGRFSAAAL